MNQKLLDKNKTKKLDWEKQMEWILANRIAYIGNEIPDYFTTDKRSKSLYLGCPQDMIDELQDFIQSLLTQQRTALLEGILNLECLKEEKIELEKPILFQTNPEPNELGGYSSFPFYCSLCGESEMTIQDNKLEEDKYHCQCSLWDSPLNCKWLGWFDKNKAKKLVKEIPSEDNIRNQLRNEIKKEIKKL